MKKTITIALLLSCMASAAQDAGQFRERYTKQVKAVGADGVDVDGN